MIDLSESIDFMTYLIKGGDFYKENQIKTYNKINLSEETIENIKTINKETKILFFGDISCPDCTSAFAILKKFQEINKNINIFYFNKSENQNFLLETTKETKMPTILKFYDSNEFSPVYIEFPKNLKNKLKKASEEEQDDLIRNYRIGEYNKIIEFDICENIL